MVRYTSCHDDIVVRMGCKYKNTGMNVYSNEDGLDDYQ